MVGDRKQLPHVPEDIALPAPVADYDGVSHSLLNSLLTLYGDALPVALLKEHYRCHPKIIQLCNKQFYDNQLIVMTRDSGENVFADNNQHIAAQLINDALRQPTFRTLTMHAQVPLKQLRAHIDDRFTARQLDFIQ